MCAHEASAILWLRALACAAAVACACIGLAPAAEPGTICPGLEKGPVRSVTRIIDGETVALDDGTELRLVGVLAPRAIDVGAEPGAWPLETAVRRKLHALLLGESIELAFGGERLDRYGRLQAHAFLVEAGGGRRWVQGELIGQGLARAYTLAGNRACARELLAAEQPARAARRGLWAEAAYRIRRADKPAELLRYRATFQVVEGRIVRVAELRSRIYLNFGRNWRRAFSASLRRDERYLLGEHSVRPRDLEGKLVRVRGWIEQRRGAPVIDLSAAGGLEVPGAPELPAAR